MVLVQLEIGLGALHVLGKPSIAGRALYRWATSLARPASISEHVWVMLMHLHMEIREQPCVSFGTQGAPLRRNRILPGAHEFQAGWLESPRDFPDSTSSVLRLQCIKLKHIIFRKQVL